MFLKRLYILILSTLFCFLSWPVSASHLATELSRDRIAMGETVTVAYTLDLNANSSPDFSGLKENFHILNTNYGKAISVLNGVSTTKTFWRLTLQPKKSGVILLPEINFGNIKSTLHQLVVDPHSPAAINDHKNLPAFVRATVSSKTPYIQSQVIYTFKLFYRLPLDNPRLEIPQIKDTTFIPLGDGNYYQTMLDGKSFQVVEKKLAIFPQKTGKIIIPPSFLRAIIYQNPFSANSDPFSIDTPKSLFLETPTITLNVQTIPDQFQGSTWLPAFNMVLTEQWSQDLKQAQTDSPITRTITLKAYGLRADQIPDLLVDKIPGINMYFDPPKRGNEIESDMLIGTWQQKITYIPDGAASLNIPPVTLKWWNLKTNKQSIIQLNALTVPIKLSKKVQDKFNASLKNNITGVGHLLAENPAAKIIPVNNPFYLSIWFWIAVVALVGWPVAIALVLKKINNIKIKSTDEKKASLEERDVISEQAFEQACINGNAGLAQQYLLAWARKKYNNSLLSLNSLRDLMNDESAKQILDQLQYAIYAKNNQSWYGKPLLVVYQQMKKHSKRHTKKMTKPQYAMQHTADPLPPLNP